LHGQFASFVPGLMPSHAVSDHEDLCRRITQKGCVGEGSKGVCAQANASGEFSGKKLILVLGSNQARIGQSANFNFDCSHLFFGFYADRLV
jgi:hypothetical protein